MCHPEVPAGQVTPTVSREEVQIPLVSGEKMPALLARPDGQPHGAVMIVSDIFGRSAFYEDLAARLAVAGFVGLLPDFFFRQGGIPDRDRPAAQERRKKLDENGTLRDLNTTLDWLLESQGATRLGTIGFCMGGTLVLDLAARRTDLATVCFYGFPAGGSEPPSEKSPPRPLDLVDEMHGPIVGFWGDQDEGVGIPNVRAFEAAMKDRNVDFSCTIYPGLGHGFLAASRLDPNHEAYEMACDAWTKSVEFYRKHLAAA